MYNQEKGLWFAVLLNALNDLKKRDYSKECYKNYLSAKYWIQCNDRRDFNSYLNICDQLGIDGLSLRERLLSIQAIEKRYVVKKKKARQNET